MDNKNQKEITIDDLKLFITKHDLLEKELSIKQEIKLSYEKSLEKIDAVEDKVDHLQFLVLPLIESSKATAANTEKLVNAFDKFAERQEQISQKQQDTNGHIYGKLSKHEVELAERKVKMDVLSDSSHKSDTMKNSTKITIISVLGTIIVALVSATPLIASMLFSK